MRLDNRAKGTAILSDCCDIPFAYVRDSGKVTVTARHERDTHMLVLTVEDLERILEIAKRNGAIIESARKVA